MLVYGVEPLSETLPEVQELWRMHWQETEGYRDELGYDPDVIAYVNMDRRGMWRQYTARDEGRLAGHVGFMLFSSRHTRAQTAGEDYFYLRKDYRGSGVATKLLTFALERLKVEGVKHVTMSSKLAVDIQPLLERVGFKFVAKQYSLIFEE